MCTRKNILKCAEKNSTAVISGQPSESITSVPLAVLRYVEEDHLRIHLLPELFQHTFQEMHLIWSALQEDFTSALILLTCPLTWAKIKPVFNTYNFIYEIYVVFHSFSRAPAKTHICFNCSPLSVPVKDP